MLTLQGQEIHFASDSSGIQVTLHRKRLAESAAQSSNGSVCDGRMGEETSQNQSTCSNEDVCVHFYIFSFIVSSIVICQLYLF